jgi:hypothetical protein
MVRGRRRAARSNRPDETRVGRPTEAPLGRTRSDRCIGTTSARASSRLWGLEHRRSRNEARGAARVALAGRSSQAKSAASTSRRRRRSDAWIRAVSASLLPLHGCRSRSGPDRTWRTPQRRGCSRPIRSPGISGGSRSARRSRRGNRSNPHVLAVAASEVIPAPSASGVMHAASAAGSNRGTRYMWRVACPPILTCSCPPPASRD